MTDTKHTPGPRSRCKHRWDRSMCPECALSRVGEVAGQTIAESWAEAGELRATLRDVDTLIERVQAELRKTGSRDFYGIDCNLANARAAFDRVKGEKP